MPFQPRWLPHPLPPQRMHPPTWLSYRMEKHWCAMEVGLPETHRVPRRQMSCPSDTSFVVDEMGSVIHSRGQITWTAPPLALSKPLHMPAQRLANAVGAQATYQAMLLLCCQILSSKCAMPLRVAAC